MSEWSPWKPSATPESPTCPMYNLLYLIIAMLAVVPEVLGKPLNVLGQLSERERKKNSQKEFTNDC